MSIVWTVATCSFLLKVQFLHGRHVSAVVSLVGLCLHGWPACRSELQLADRFKGRSSSDNGSQFVNNRVCLRAVNNAFCWSHLSGLHDPFERPYKGDVIAANKSSSLYWTLASESFMEGWEQILEDR